MTTSLSAPNQAMPATAVSMGGMLPSSTAAASCAAMSALKRSWSRCSSELEGLARADGVDEEEPGHGAMTGEHREHRPQGHIGTLDGILDAGHGTLDLADEPVGGRAQQLEEERLLGREVEVDAALARLGLPTHLVDAGLAVAAPAEDGEGGIEDALPPPLAAFLSHLSPCLR